MTRDEGSGVVAELELQARRRHAVGADAHAQLERLAGEELQPVEPSWPTRDAEAIDASPEPHSRSPTPLGRVASSASARR